MKLKLLTSAAALAVAGSVFTATAAKAEELWDPYLRGFGEGIPSGALAPPGFYGELDNYYADYTKYDRNGNSIPGTHLSALVEVPVLIYIPNFKVLGATYGMAIGLPFDYTSYAPTQSEHPGGGNLGMYNTVLIPGALSWQLPHNLFARVSLTVLLPTATNTMSDYFQGNVKNGGVPSGNAFTTFQPDFAVSWLYNGWNVTAAGHVSFNVGDDNNYAGIHGNSYHSTSEFTADYAVTKTMGRWTLGVGGSQANQFSNDTLNGASVANTRVTSYSVGPIVGYEFPGGMSVTAVWNHFVSVHNDVGGDFVDFRFLTAFEG
ncbi:SphA family protein [Acidocella aromatica]|uniref:Phenol degradation protein meta n=1 Tax=Acidocella aromatica TaxID=1303579 RepID=A0A840VEL7_9PROT|nr:transporter [Acidocella aromatica]MBB5374278.1 hypothetical protein [Acidocella aromatica]